MERKFCVRFQKVAESIFNELSDESIWKCKEVSRDWNMFLCSGLRFISVRKIKKAIENHRDSLCHKG